MPASDGQASTGGEKGSIGRRGSIGFVAVHLDGKYDKKCIENDDKNEIIIFRYNDC